MSAASLSTLPVGSPGNPSESVAESCSPAELRTERAFLTLAVAKLKEHKASVFLLIVGLTAGSAGILLYYRNKAASLSSRPSSTSTPLSPSSSRTPHSLTPTIARLQRQAMRALHNGDLYAALSLLTRAISLSSIPPPLPAHLLSSLYLDRANVHFLLHAFPSSLTDAQHSATLLPITPSPLLTRRLLLQARALLMQRLYPQAAELLVRILHEQGRRRGEEEGDSEVVVVARKLLRQCVDPEVHQRPPRRHPHPHSHPSSTHRPPQPLPHHLRCPPLNPADHRRHHHQLPLCHSTPRIAHRPAPHPPLPHSHSLEQWGWWGQRGRGAVGCSRQAQGRRGRRCRR